YFFQAGDGIRDATVTGVQTCALPIYWSDLFQGKATAGTAVSGSRSILRFRKGRCSTRSFGGPIQVILRHWGFLCCTDKFLMAAKIGRASCREKWEACMQAATWVR